MVAIRIVDCGLRKEKGATLKDLYLSDKFTFKDLTFQSVILLLLSRYFRVELKVLLALSKSIAKNTRQFMIPVWYAQQSLGLHDLWKCALKL